jgi:sortase A
MRKRGWSIWIESALTIAGAACLTYYFWVQHKASEAQWQARRCQSRMGLVRRGEATTPNSSRTRLRHGDIVGELEIPRLRLSVMVFEGDDSSILDLGAGHIPGTALPEARGNIGIAAHRDTYFWPLRLIRPNDEIGLKTARGTQRYTVTRTQVVPPSDAEVLASAPNRDLTLVTCYPFHYVGSSPERFVVYARKSG